MSPGVTVGLGVRVGVAEGVELPGGVRVVAAASVGVTGVAVAGASWTSVDRLNRARRSAMKFGLGSST
jgi:hypothetical protein